MLQSTHYNLNLAEGTDLVNPLTIDVPNYQTIDNTMYANEQSGVGSATELKSGTIHAITRTAPARNVFRFTATSIFNSGDTFTVDGGTVTALYPDQSSLKDRCFIVGSEVLCLLTGSQLTILASYIQSATEVPFDDTNVSYTANNVQSAIESASTATGTEYSTGISVKAKIDSLKTIQVLTGSLSNSSGDTSIPYPSEFTFNNTIIVSLQVYYNNNWRNGSSADAIGASGRLFTYLKGGEIAIYNDISGLYGASYKLSIMKQ